MFKPVIPKVMASSTSLPMQKMSTFLPFTGLYTVILTSMGILSTGFMAETESEKIISLVTVYVAFSIVGLLDIITFYLSKDLSPRHSEIFSIVIAFLVEYLVFSADKEEESGKSSSFCLNIAIAGCLASSVINMFSNTPITIFSMIVFTQAQGTWIIHSSFLTCRDNTSYLYFSWHILAVFICTLVITVVINMCLENNLTNHMTTKHAEFATSVDKISDVYSETNTGLTVVSQEDIVNKDDYHKDTKQESEPAHVYENYEVGKQDKEIDEINNVLTSIDRLVNDGMNHINNNSSDKRPGFVESKDEIRIKKTKTSERLSPLEQFNTLHRHVNGARASIKLKRK